VGYYDIYFLPRLDYMVNTVEKFSVEYNQIMRKSVILVTVI